VREGFVATISPHIEKKSLSQGFSLCPPGLSLVQFHQHQSMSQQQQKEQQYGDVTYKDQVRKARLPFCSLNKAATRAAVRRGGQRATAATIADSIPVVSAEAVSESRIAAEEHEVRLREAERRAAAAEAARQLAEAATAHGNCCCVLVVVVVVLIAAVAAVAGICGTGHCSPPTPLPVPQTVPVTTMPITATATARAGTILSYINSITLSVRTLMYPSNSSAEERAIRWLIEHDSGSTVDDEQSLRQRYVLGTLWFLNATTHFGTASHTLTWTTNKDECEWSDVVCDGNGRLTALYLGMDKVRGQIPHDLGLLTDLTHLSLRDNQMSGTIPLTLGALTALTYLSLKGNEMVGTMPFCSTVQSFLLLEADCVKVNCTCCTACCPAALGNIPRSSYCSGL
jgi:hypothetical protein